jgi:hypothetical protein
VIGEILDYGVNDLDAIPEGMEDAPHENGRFDLCQSDAITNKCKPTNPLLQDVFKSFEGQKAASSNFSVDLLWEEGKPADCNQDEEDYLFLSYTCVHVDQE